jgi:probable rRNA maturation factor
VTRIRKGKLIPREDGKRIEEFVGVANTGTSSVSVARMLAPPGWREPPQMPEFDEVVMVLKGTLTLVQGRRATRIEANEIGFVPKGTRVVYRNDGGGACDYYSVCVPAFRSELAHMEPAKVEKAPSEVAVQSSHPKGRRLERRVLSDAKRFLAAMEIDGAELSVALVGDLEIRKLNRQWRRKDKATDVLSFPAGEMPPGTPGPKPLGDVIISLDTAVRVAKEEGRKMEEEVSRYLAHGILHLLGYDHERSAAEARKMATLEEKLLGGEGLIPGPKTPKRKR